MAHMQKFKGSAAAHIIGHCERERDKEGYLKYNNNSYIDESKTPLNYAYQANGHRRLKARLNEIAPNRRKDAVTMVDWVVTLPEQLKNSDTLQQQRFFDITEEFLENRYGKTNLVSSHVHLDETTPHLHYCFVPVVTDKKSGKEKLCCKELMTKSELNKFHKELDKQMALEFNISGLILTGTTKTAGGNKTITQLKAKTAAESVEKLKCELKVFQDKINAQIVDFKASMLFSFLNDISRGRSVRQLLIDPAYCYYFVDIKAKKNVLLLHNEVIEKYFAALPSMVAHDSLNKELGSFMESMGIYAEFDPLEKYQHLKQLQKDTEQAKAEALKTKQQYEVLYNRQFKLNESHQLLQNNLAEIRKENYDLYQSNKNLEIRNQNLQSDFDYYKNELDKSITREAYYSYHYGAVSQEQAEQFQQEMEEKRTFQKQNMIKTSRRRRQKNSNLEL